MRLFLAHLFDLSGRLVHTLEVNASSFDTARVNAHERLGSPEFIASQNHELWVVPA